jgi:hypothetical protein
MVLSQLKSCEWPPRVHQHDVTPFFGDAMTVLVPVRDKTGAKETPSRAPERENMK